LLVRRCRDVGTGIGAERPVEEAMRAEIFWIGGVPAGRLAVLPRPRGGDWLEDEIRSLRFSGVDVLVSLLARDEVEELDLADEARCCAAGGIEFVSFPFADRGVPASLCDTLSLVRRLAALLVGGKTVVIHCRQGVGRSALVAACGLASLGERPEAAFARIATARGRPVPDTPEQREWVLRFADRHLKRSCDTTLLLSTRAMPGTAALADATRQTGWSVHAWDEDPPDSPGGRVVYYGRTDVLRQAAARYRLALLEPPLDLLARLPASLLLRTVEFASFRDLSRLKRPKPRSPALPPAFVVDVGLVEGRGWAVVEFNPVWCSGLLGADPAAVLAVLERACRNADGFATEDRRWLVDRGRRG
jgi:protein-tyrosine phosphatase